MAFRKAKEAEQDEATPVVHEWPSPAKPSALLVPRYIIDNNRAAVTRRYSVIAVGVVALLTAAGVAFAFLGAITSKNALTEAEGARDAAQVNVDRLKPIADYYDGLEKRAASTTGLLSGNIAHARLLRAFQDTMPPGVVFTSYAPAVGAPCPSPDPFATSDALGCITAQVTAQTEAQASALLTNIENAPDGLLADPFVSGLSSNASAQGDTVDFTLSVNFTSAAYSGEFAETDEEGDDQ